MEDDLRWKTTFGGGRSLHAAQFTLRHFFISFKVALFLTGCFRAVTRHYKQVLRVFHGSFKGVSRLFESDSRKFQRPFKQVTRGFQDGVKDIVMVFHGSFKNIFRVFQRSFMLHGTHRSYPSRRRTCFWRERAAFQRSAFGRLTDGNDVVATIFIRLFFFFPFFSPLS